MKQWSAAAGLIFCCVAAQAGLLSSGVPVSDGGTDNNIAYPNTGRKVACGPNGTIYVVYYGATNGIRVAHSTDRGQSFEPSVQVSASSAEVEINVDADGIVHVAWGAGGNITYSRSTDGGATFSAPRNVGTTGGTVHMAVDAPWVYLVPRDGSNLYANGASGVGDFSQTATGGGWAFADVHVDHATGDVVLAVDDPVVSFFTSNDHGATLNGQVTPGGNIYYSTAVFAATDTQRYLYVGGGGLGGGTEDDGLRIDIDAETSTPITLGATTNSQGRTLAVDAFNNVIDGYVDGTEVKFAVSNDNGAAFDAPITVASADYLSVAINRYYGDVVVAYEAGGEIFCNVYGSLIQQAPSVATAAPTNIAMTSATLAGEVISDGGAAVTVRGLCWNTTGEPTVSDDSLESGSGVGSFSESVSGLSADTTYYVRAYAVNGLGTSYGAEQTFQTLSDPDPPTVTTAALTDIGSDSATGGGEVTADGGAAVTARGVCWNTTGGPTIADDATSDGTGTGAFTSDLTSLTPGATYYVRAYATNAAGTSYGQEVSFSTSAVVPTVVTGEVSDVGSDAASVAGEVLDDGGAAVSAAGVCWNTSGAPTVDDDKTADGAAAGAFVSALSGLTPETTYYVRAYAANSAGTGYGVERTFVTTTTVVEEPIDPDPPAEDDDQIEDEEPNAPAPPATAPNLRVTIAAPRKTVSVGEQVTFEVAIENIGDGQATGVEMRFPLPPGTRFVGVWLRGAPSAQDAPLNAYLDGDEIVVTLGNLDPAAGMMLEVVLEADSAGAVALEAKATADEQPDPVQAKADANVEIDDVYWEVVSTVAPVNACGLFGVVSPLLMLGGLLSLKRRGGRL